MVKISGRTKDGGHLGAHLAYISRNSALPLEGPDGARVETRDEVKALATDWMAEVEADPRRRKDASVSLSIVLSMPPGTDPFRMYDASRAFAARTFGETHPYVFAFHTDERHPHVHLTVRTLGHEGRKLNPRKADLEQWRQTFAAVLRDRGVEAEATPRRSRGVVRKAEVGAVRRMRTYFFAQAMALSRSPDAEDHRWPRRSRPSSRQCRPWRQDRRRWRRRSKAEPLKRRSKSANRPGAAEGMAELDQRIPGAADVHLAELRGLGPMPPEESDLRQKRPLARCPEPDVTTKRLGSVPILAVL